MEDPRDLAQSYREMREARSPDDRDRWIPLIKELRVTHGCGIYEAERIALSEPHWRRWVERQINKDLRRARMARHHIREHGEAALLVEKDGRLTVR